MRTHISAQPHLAQCLKTLKAAPCLAAILAATILTTAATLHAATQSSTPHQTTNAHKRTSATKQPNPAPLPPPEPVAPPAPKPPDWPANDHPADAAVVWNSQGLRIDAANSSLSQILKDVSTVTGTKVEGLGPDQRIFGTYGPGPARDVLAKLLDGSGYNILMIGDQGHGTPRSIVLTPQSKGGETSQVSNNEPQANDDSADADEQPEQPQPQPPSIRNGFAPGAPPRTPQQIMQEMQQRQLQQQPTQGPPPQ
jgi:hypothetical protein